MERHIGIITPTFKRHRFLPKVLRQLRGQTHRHLSFVLISDGPDARTRRLFEEHAQGDPRLHYLETERYMNDWGSTPRLLGMRTLAALPQPPSHVCLWDDDDEYFPEAVRNIATELQQHQEPDLLLMPVTVRNELMPPAHFTVSEAKGGQVMTANMVVRLTLALEHYPHIVPRNQERGEDFAFFARVRALEQMRIAVSKIPPIGKYDGLRPLQNLRWKLRIPALNIAERNWYLPLRRRLRD